MCNCPCDSLVRTSRAVTLTCRSSRRFFRKNSYATRWCSGSPNAQHSNSTGRQGDLKGGHRRGSGNTKKSYLTWRISKVCFKNAFQAGRRVPQGLRPAFLLAHGGTAELHVFFGKSHPSSQPFLLWSGSWEAADDAIECLEFPLQFREGLVHGSGLIRSRQQRQQRAFHASGRLQRCGGGILPT